MSSLKNPYDIDYRNLNANLSNHDLIDNSIPPININIVHPLLPHVITTRRTRRSCK